MKILIKEGKEERGRRKGGKGSEREREREVGQASLLRILKSNFVYIKIKR